MRIKYHLKKQIDIEKKFKNANKSFNLRHSQLRNVIKKIFNIFKKRFLFMNYLKNFDISIQIRTQFGFTTLHNFIILYRLVNNENIFIVETSNNNNINDQKSSKNIIFINTKMNKFRDEITIII